MGGSGCRMGLFVFKKLENSLMTEKSTYEGLEKEVREANKESTERRLVEEELNTVRAALNSAASGVLITDKKGRIKYANPAFLRMFEYESQKEVAGKYAAELFAPQEGRRFVDIGAIIDKSKGETEEFQALRKDGTIFHVEVSTSSITDNEGHDMGRMASFVDITDRKQMEKALKESSQKEVLQVIREEFSSQLSIREIRWSEPDYIPEIEADRLCIIRALRNLLDNALKYGGEALSEIDIKYKGSGESHILSVKDNGIGLKKQDSHQDIFAPFIRSKTSKGIQGSGLGLAILREIAEKHNGEVWLKPGQKRGITFYISIPKNLQIGK